MWTGRTAHESGMLGLAHRGFDLRDRDAHFMRHLAGQGYRTLLSGLQHEYVREAGEVYDVLLATEPHPLEARDFYAADQAAEFMESNDEGPWALSVGFFYPHREFLKAEPGAGDYVKVPDPLQEAPQIRADYADYLKTVGEMDRCFGRVIEGLKKSGQADNTVVVFTTDHGIAFPEMKCQLTGHGTGISLMLSSPSQIEGGSVRDALVSHLDLVPTLSDLLGVKAPSGLLGSSLRPLIDGEIPSVREDLFAEVNFHAAAEPARSVRTQDFNYIVRFEEDLRQPLSNIDDSPSKELWVKDVLKNRSMERVRLFDLKRDPQERHNIADDPEYKVIRADMEARLARWMQTTDDPLLQGDLKIPAGARVNTRTSTDPRNGPFEATEAESVSK